MPRADAVIKSRVILGGRRLNGFPLIATIFFLFLFVIQVN